MVRSGAPNRGRGGGARMANLADVYDCDDADRDATTGKRLQLVEQRLKQLHETMLAQFVALQVGRQPHHHPRNHASEEEEVFDGEPAIPFADYPPRVRRKWRVFPNNRNSRWETGLKIDIPEFYGGLSAKDFLDWVNVVDILEFKEVPEEKWVHLVATRFRRRAAAWWQQTKLTRNRKGKQKISS
ncbi:hypothetical protein Acr_00g0057020 [Actinidia rufa]|uniref:Uncharacterized protein n=1 Tax=Actinidia rufa TaxID=165716 RepID=A0A7J0DNX1_9ERIC|nr:hypothetical protein Acr_00g0057020 [Actinidia rufa]